MTDSSLVLLGRALLIDTVANASEYDEADEDHDDDEDGAHFLEG